MKVSTARPTTSPTARPTWSLQKKAHVWYLSWAVPKSIQCLPQFSGRRLYTKTLQTGDLREAQLRRDSIIASFGQHLLEAEANEAASAAQEFSQYLAGLRTSISVAGATTASPSPSIRPVRKPTPKPAPQPTPKPAKPKSTSKGVTVQEAAAEFLKEAERRAAQGKPITEGTLSRVRNASVGIAEFTGKQALGEIERRDVTLWIASLAGEKSDNTRKKYLSAMSLVWEHCYLLRMVDGDNPFKNTGFKSTGDLQSYEPLSLQEMSEIVRESDTALRVLVKFGLITGCRLGEIVGLREADFEIEDGVHVLRIRAGKTASAIRSLPLPKPLWEELRAQVVGRLWHLQNGDTNASQWSNKFGVVKAKVTGSRDRVKGFHSLRGMAITGYQRAGIPEDVTAPLVGHSTKGLTLSYGLYSSGHTLPHQLQAVESMLASEYMQQYLDLFK